MKKFLFCIHILTFSLIATDNFLLFNYLKDNSNDIKEKLGAIKPLRSLLSTIIVNFNYRKPAEKEFKPYYVDNGIVEIIGKKRASQQKLFLTHYRNNGSILSNTIIMADIVHEFMEDKIDTLFLPFNASNYCYDIQETQWCQIQSIDLFVYPIAVSIKKYDPNLGLNQFNALKKKTNISISGSNDTMFNLMFHEKRNNSLNYYLYVHGKDAFISSNIF